MLEMACQGLYRCTYMPDCAGKAAGQLFSLRGAPDEGTIGAKQLVAHAVYHTFKIYSYHCTSTNCLMSSIKKLSFQPSKQATHTITMLPSKWLCPTIFPLVSTSHNSCHL